MTTNAKLRALVELAETGSVRAAAARLVVSDSAVSSAISALSAEIGVALVSRQSRGVRLTPAGERYVEYARRILGLHAEAVRAAAAEADPEQGAVRVAAVATVGEFLIPTMLASFRAKHPSVVLQLEVAPCALVWPMLARHAVDLVVAGRPPDDLRCARVRATSPNALIVVGSPEKSVDFDPTSLTWLLREPAAEIPAATSALLERMDITAPQMTLDSNDELIAAATAGLGVTLVSRHAVRRELDNGTLVELPVAGTPLERPWHVVSQVDPTASTNLLVEHLLTAPELDWHEASN